MARQLRKGVLVFEIWGHISETEAIAPPMIRSRFLLATLAFLVPAFASTAGAQADQIAGRYQCAEVRINGKPAPCKSAPLILKSDGSFEIRGREGQYQVDGNWLVLSGEAKNTKAKLIPGYKIVFRYRYRGGICEVTFQRKVAELGNSSLS